MTWYIQSWQNTYPRIRQEAISFQQATDSSFYTSITLWLLHQHSNTSCAKKNNATSPIADARTATITCPKPQFYPTTSESTYSTPQSKPTFCCALPTCQSPRCLLQYRPQVGIHDILQFIRFPALHSHFFGGHGD